MGADDRESIAQAPNIINDPDAIARKEAENALRQFDAVLDTIDSVSRDGRDFKLRPSLILGLHRLALADLSEYSGVFRPGSVSIGKSRHQPPPAHLVPSLIEEMCD